MDRGRIKGNAFALQVALQLLSDDARLIVEMAALIPADQVPEDVEAAAREYVGYWRWDSRDGPAPWMCLTRSGAG